MAIRHLLLVWFIAFSLGNLPNAFSAPPRPLLMPDKQSLYQRVLSKPGALLFT